MHCEDAVYFLAAINSNCTSIPNIIMEEKNRWHYTSSQFSLG